MNEIGTLQIKTICHSKLEYLYKKLVSQDYDQPLLVLWYNSIFQTNYIEFEGHMYFEILNMVEQEILFRVSAGKVTLARRI